MDNKKMKTPLAAAAMAASVMLFGAAAHAEVSDDQITSMLMVDQLEYRFGEHEEYIAWAGQLRIGSDEDKIAFKTEGEKVIGGATESVETQIVYQRLISRFFDAQVGLRHDFEPGPTRTYGVFGVQGLAPQWFEVDANALIRTISEFNAACVPGEFNPAILDGVTTTGLDVNKTNWALPIDKPPYVAYVTTTGITFTFGGLKIDDHNEVQDLDNRSIPGLYAAGELVGGLFYENYPGGSGLMSGSVFGKRAGACAAEYARGRNTATAD